MNLEEKEEICNVRWKSKQNILVKCGPGIYSLKHTMWIITYIHVPGLGLIFEQAGPLIQRCHLITECIIIFYHPGYGVIGTWDHFQYL